MEPARRYVTPSEVLVGTGARAEVGTLATRFEARRALIVVDPVLARRGIARELASHLDGQGIASSVFAEVVPDPTVADVDRCAAAARAAACDLVIGVGGGSTLDMAKGAALTATAAGPFSMLVEESSSLGRCLPKILLPSTSGSGSEVSQAIVVTDEGRRRKMALHAPWVLADVAIVDPELAVSMPPAVTAETGLDALTHGLEALLSANSSTPSDALAEKACACVWHWLPVAHAHGEDLEARARMCEGALLAGMAFTWAGLGGVHALAYPLTLQYGLSHGRANAVMLPHVLRHTFAAVPAAVPRVAAALGLDFGTVRSADEAVAALSAFVEDLGISIRLRDAGVAKNETRNMASSAIRESARLLATHPCELREDDAARIYDQAW